ncbi:DNA alkylation repair protein [Oceanobacter mangrovi]|uniref:DNA alkylation repair protein n=1 Tax=Oceanobacter mangrovi TaxID=2862510 RepID=UPI001C8D0050|nr:DNA alkylation repair protein [Oceanobacter mangrovi]
MAEPLKNRYGLEVAEMLAQQLTASWPEFDREGFMTAVSDGYDALELMDRGRHLGHWLGKFLPADYPQAVEILLASLGQPLSIDRSFSMSAFYYLPHTCFVAEYGLDHFEQSMRAQYELTQRFTAEFSIRPFLERYPQQTLELLHQWSADANHHVRRLVSEGTRPRLPWGKRLYQFIDDPAPVVELLQRLKDDPELYVRRSVANNLNDIGKDHPELLVDICRDWWRDGSEDRRWLVRHALRSAIKRCDPQALALLGYGAAADELEIIANLDKQRVQLGDSIEIQAQCRLPAGASESQSDLQLMIDFRVWFLKANGKQAARVFKLKKLTISPGEQLQLSKRLALVPMTTRKLYAGEHRVELVVNGTTYPVGSFDLSVT